jgi:hypothetical protein
LLGRFAGGDPTLVAATAERHADWAVGNMRLVDAAYAAAGFDRGRQA